MTVWPLGSNAQIVQGTNMDKEERLKAILECLSDQSLMLSHKILDEYEHFTSAPEATEKGLNMLLLLMEGSSFAPDNPDSIEVVNLCWAAMRMGTYLGSIHPSISVSNN